MNREKELVKPLKIIKVIEDRGHKNTDEKCDESKIIFLLVSDAKKSKYIIRYISSFKLENDPIEEIVYGITEIEARCIKCPVDIDELTMFDFCERFDWTASYLLYNRRIDGYEIDTFLKTDNDIDWKEFIRKKPIRNNLNIADLHIHTINSDGTDSPWSLINRLKEERVTIVSVTDHDNIDFYKDIENDTDGEKYGLLSGMRLIPGIEFSCKTECGKCHILGYGIDINNHILDATIKMANALRDIKLINRIDFLKEKHNILLDDADKLLLMMEKSVGKPHIASILVKKGLAENISDAISKFLSNIPNDGDDRIDAQIAIDTIVAAGGIPVWAHPLGGVGEKRLSEEQFTEQLHCLASKGIQGIEMYYSLYSSVDRKLISRALLKNNYASKLCVSGGSDYHGRNKKVKPGELAADDEVIFGKWLSILSKVKINYDNRFETCSIDETKFLCDNVVFALGKEINKQVAGIDGENDFIKRYNFLCNLFDKSPLFNERHFEEAPKNNKWYYSENGLIHFSLCEDKNNPSTLISRTEASALNKNFLDDLMTVFADSLGRIPKYEVTQIVGLQTITLC